MPHPPDNDDPPSDPRPKIDEVNRVLRFLRPPVMRFVRYEYQFEFANGPPVIIVRGDSEEETESSEETSSSATTTTTAAATSTTATAAAAAAMGANGSTATDFRRECDHVSLGDLCYGVCFASNLPNLVLMILYYYYPPLSSSNQ